MATVSVVPYSTEWPRLFAAIRDELVSLWAPARVAVEHVGSTSVPGLAAKPVIDVVLGAPSLADIEEHIPALQDSGYAYVAKYERELPMRRYFVKSPPASLRVHLHGVEHDSRSWREYLAFRDALRADAALRAQYHDLKLRLAAVHALDKAAYSAAKDPFIQSVVAGLSLASPTRDAGAGSDTTPLIRALGPVDAGAWAALRAEALSAHPLIFGSSVPADRQQLVTSFHDRISSGDESVILGAFSAARLVGSVGIRRETGTKERHKAYLWGMFVRPDGRRLGAGVRLLRAAVSQARAWPGVEDIRLSVSEAAPEAQRLYERHGFRAWGREPRVLSIGGGVADEIHMVLSLDDGVGADGRE